jgi:ribosomal protein S18 acetylase RimI-like enzyme
MELLRNILIRPMRPDETPPYALLLLADPSQQVLETYLHDAELFLCIYNKEVIGVYALLPLDSESLEIKNIAIDEAYQGKGLGQYLLEHAAQKARARGYRKLFIGTANSSTGQLYLYQKVGFELCEVKFNFFTDQYPTPIFENGIQAKHLVMLCKELQSG